MCACNRRPQNILITLAEEADVVTVAVTDDGRGFRRRLYPLAPLRGVHPGLDTVVKRARAAGGYVDIASAPGEGTRVSIAVPSAAAPA